MNLNLLLLLLIFFLFGGECTPYAPASSSSSSSSSLIKKACTVGRGSVDLNLCVRTLESYREILPAKSLPDLAKRILTVGLSNSTATRSYIERAMTKNPPKPLMHVLKECKAAYDTLMPTYRIAISEITEDKDYETATYDLLIMASDYVGQCEKAVASNKVGDPVILSGNKAVELFGLSTYQIACDLQKQQGG
ncbi:hypothetical protein M569_10387 [Genlisea aurea]|uniref:Pectinesterase inhibitor domain-containing protein n=1 Tax=Genlisea aurea TaxID=192259 RepID=S8DWZ3_9LAMI|nr:hypothetical protein M569_10387 [Genlisea aurea]